MALGPQQPLAPGPLDIVRPVWTDAPFLGVQNAYRITKVVPTTNSPYLFARNSPTRWALGYVFHDLPIIDPTIRVQPTSDTTLWGWPSTTTPQWFTLFNYGPLVALEWYAINCQSLEFTVYEVFNQ